MKFEVVFLADGFGASDVDFEDEVEFVVVGVVLGVGVLDDADEPGHSDGRAQLFKELAGQGGFAGLDVPAGQEVP